MSLLFALCAINRQLQHLNNADRMFLRVLFTLWAIKSNSEGVKFSAVNQPSLVAHVTGKERVISAAVKATVDGEEVKLMFPWTSNDGNVGNRSIHQSVLVSPWEESVLMKSEATGYLFCRSPPLF